MPGRPVFPFQHSYVGTLLGHIRRFGVQGLLRPLASADPGGLSRQQTSAVAISQLAARP